MPPSRGNPISIRRQQLAEGRSALHLTQTELARQVGVSRQFLNQVESGRVLPNVLTALRLAAALATTVEELFGAAAAGVARLVPVTLASPALTPGTRLRLGRVGQAWIAHAADTVGSLAAGFGAADAVLDPSGHARLLVPAGNASGNVLVAGCDSALALLASPTTARDGGRLHWIECGSGRALDLLAAGQVHVAGIHYPGVNGSGNLDEVRMRDPQRQWHVLQFTRWEQGWIVRPGDGRKFAGVASLGRGKWKLANRDASTAARRWLDQELAAARIKPSAVAGYARALPTASAGAQAVANGIADVTVGPQALAVTHGLDFLPAQAVDFDLVAPASWWTSSAGRELRHRITELSATGIFASLPGYTATQSGTERPRVPARKLRR